MPWCSHCNRNVSVRTEFLHRKHGVRPRLTTDAVAAFRKSVKTSTARITRNKARVSPPTPAPDVSMNEGPSAQQVDHDFVMDTSATIYRLDESRDTLFRTAMSSAQSRLWPEGTRPYAARVDDYESDAEDEEENGNDGGNGMNDWSFDDDEDDVIDITEYANGLSAWDELGEEFEREAGENGQLVPGLFNHANADRLVGRSKYQCFRHGYFACICAESRVAHDR